MLDILLGVLLAFGGGLLILFGYLLYLAWLGHTPKQQDHTDCALN
jgi:hypothetical protein